MGSGTPFSLPVSYRQAFKARSSSEKALLQGAFIPAYLRVFLQAHCSDLHPPSHIQTPILAGLCCSLAVSSAGLAVSAAAFGSRGQHVALIWHAANLVAGKAPFPCCCMCTRFSYHAGHIPSIFRTCRSHKLYEPGLSLEAILAGLSTSWQGQQELRISYIRHIDR